MVSKDDRHELWQTFISDQEVTPANLEKWAWADLNDLADQVHARLDLFDTPLTDRQIASEVRHEALRQLTDCRRTDADQPEMAMALCEE